MPRGAPPAQRSIAAAVALWAMAAGSYRGFAAAAPQSHARGHAPGKALWVEGGALDGADKRISSVIFELRLPALAEVVLSVPGAFAGMPHAFLGPTPLALACLAGSGSSDAGYNSLRQIAALQLALAVLSFYAGLAGWADSRKVLKLILVYNAVSTLAVLTRQWVPPAAAAYGLLSLSCCTLSVTATLFLKACFDRLRPAVALRLIDDVQRRRGRLFVEYIQIMCAGGQSREALPSSDAATMATAVVLMCAATSPAGAATLAASAGLLALCFVGRMYFWAHHLLDVTAGAAIGATLTSIMLVSGLGRRLRDAVAALVLFALALAWHLKRTKET